MSDEDVVSARAGQISLQNYPAASRALARAPR